MHRLAKNTVVKVVQTERCSECGISFTDFIGMPVLTSPASDLADKETVRCTVKWLCVSCLRELVERMYGLYWDKRRGVH